MFLISLHLLLMRFLSNSDEDTVTLGVNEKLLELRDIYLCKMLELMKEHLK